MPFGHQSGSGGWISLVFHSFHVRSPLHYRPRFRCILSPHIDPGVCRLAGDWMRLRCPTPSSGGSHWAALLATALFFSPVFLPFRNALPFCGFQGGMGRWRSRLLEHLTREVSPGAGSLCVRPFRLRQTSISLGRRRRASWWLRRGRHSTPRHRSDPCFTGIFTGMVGRRVRREFQTGSPHPLGSSRWFCATAACHLPSQWGDWRAFWKKTRAYRTIRGLQEREWEKTCVCALSRTDK